MTPYKYIAGGKGGGRRGNRRFLYNAYKSHLFLAPENYMENLFLFAIFTTAFFVLLKIVEMKTLEKEMKPLKFVVRDAAMAFAASLAAAFTAFYSRNSVSDFLNIVTENKVLSTETTQIFTDAPGF